MTGFEPETVQLRKSALSCGSEQEFVKVMN